MDKKSKNSKEEEFLKRVQQLKMKELWDNRYDEEFEDTMELNEKTKKELAEARAEAKQGKIKSLEEVKKELGL